MNFFALKKNLFKISFRSLFNERFSSLSSFKSCVGEPTNRSLFSVSKGRKISPYLFPFCESRKCMSKQRIPPVIPPDGAIFGEEVGCGGMGRAFFTFSSEIRLAGLKAFWLFFQLGEPCGEPCESMTMDSKPYEKYIFC